MYVYIVRSRYAIESIDITDYYVEDVFSTREKAAAFIRKFDPENDIYTEDSGVLYEVSDLARRTFSNRDKTRTLTIYCERWEVK